MNLKSRIYCFAAHSVSWRVSNRVLVSLAISLVVFVAVVLVLWTVPVADDFCRAALCFPFSGRAGVERLCFDNIWEYAWQSYNTHTGRILAIFLEAAFLSNLPHTMYPALIFSIWLVFAASIWAVVAVFVGNTDTSRWRIGCITSFLFVLLWTGAPAPGETFYWFTGAVEYLFPASLLLFCFAVCSGRKLSESCVSQMSKRLIVVSLLGLAIPFFHEAVGALGVLVSLAGTFVGFYVQGRSRYLWFGLLLCLSIGMMFSISAPGNSARSGWFEGGHDLLQSVAILVTAFSEFVLPWMLDAKLLAISLVVVTSAWYYRIATPRQSMDEKASVVAVAMTLGGLGMLFFGVAWSTGNVGPGRLHNLAYLVFLCGWFAVLFFLEPALRSIVELENVFTQLVRSLGLTVFSLGLLFSGNFIAGLRDLVGSDSAAVWHRLTNERYAYIEAQRYRDRSMVLVDKLEIPATYFQRDIEPDPEHWRNMCVAKYFSVGSIAARGR